MAELEKTIELINKNLGKLYCLGGLTQHTLIHSHPDTYPHPSGLLADNGKRYWLVYRCGLCGYENAWWKILRQLHTLDD